MNLDNILRDWAKIRYKKVLSRHWTGSRGRGKKDKVVSYFFNSFAFRPSFSAHTAALMTKTDFCSYHILTLSARRTATWNLFVKTVSLLLLSPSFKSLTVWHEAQATLCLFEVCANKTETLHCLHKGSGSSMKISSEFLPAVDSHVLQNGEKNWLPCSLRLIYPAETTVKK